MFSIHWYTGSQFIGRCAPKMIERQTSSQTLLIEVVAAMRASAGEVVARNPSRKPDTFKVFDDFGREMGHYTLR